MTCSCDKPRTVAGPIIAPGLATIPRQIAGFAGFRQAMLAGVHEGPDDALARWRARGEGDLGMLLLEFGAYVLDVLAFYDETIAHEAYLRTARLPASLARLVGLIGYRPRPATAASVRLAVLLEGRQVVTLPRGTAFRSGAFGREPPQVFELDEDQRVHPLLNRWQLASPRDAGALADGRTLLVQAGARVHPGDLVLQTGAGGGRQARRVLTVSDAVGSDGAKFLKVVFAGAAVTPDSPVTLLRPGQSARLWTGQGASAASGTTLTLDTLYNGLAAGQDVVVTAGAPIRRFGGVRLNELTLDAGLLSFANSPMAMFTGSVAGSIATTSAGTQPPAAFTIASVRQVGLDIDTATITKKGENPTQVKSRVQVTEVTLAGPWPFGTVSASQVSLHFGFDEVAREARPVRQELRATDPLFIEPPAEAPADGSQPGRVLLRDLDGTGLDGTASVDFAVPRLTGFATDLPWGPLRPPVEVFGNVITASRGETVPWEVLGNGDASQANQVFTLQKQPLTYLPATDAGALVSTLKVYVAGVLWREVASMTLAGPEDRVYVLRAGPDGATRVLFGDGRFGTRLPTGRGIVAATYRFGAGKASPPAGSISQIATPVTGLQAVRNPVAATGGTDAESPAGIRSYAPRSALVLGRAVSIPDMEAVAASANGVRAVRAEWAWSEGMQRAAVVVRFIGPASQAGAVQAKLRAAAAPDAPIEAVAATPEPVELRVSIEVDPSYRDVDVLPVVREALAGGPLAVESVGIGVPLFRSVVLAACIAVPGVAAVAGLTWNGAPFVDFAKAPPAGHYFDFELGSIIITGAGSHG